MKGGVMATVQELSSVFWSAVKVQPEAVKHCNQLKFCALGVDLHTLEQFNKVSWKHVQNK